MITVQKVDTIEQAWRELDKIARFLNELEKVQNGLVTDVAAIKKRLGIGGP